jgi:hypothetical protein
MSSDMSLRVRRAEELAEELEALVQEVFNAICQERDPHPQTMTLYAILHEVMALTEGIRTPTGPQPALTPSHPLFKPFSTIVYLLSAFAAPGCMRPLLRKEELDRDNPIYKRLTAGLGHPPRPVFPSWVPFSSELKTFQTELFEIGSFDKVSCKVERMIANAFFDLDWDRGALEARALVISRGVDETLKPEQVALVLGCNSFLAHAWLDKTLQSERHPLPRCVGAHASFPSLLRCLLFAMF